MYLKTPFWRDGSNTGTQDDSQSPVADLVNSLDRQRLYREITLALRTGLNDARAEFSFLRVRALNGILKFLRSVAESDATINLFRHSQSIPELQGRSFLPFFFLKYYIYIFDLRDSEHGLNVYEFCTFWLIYILVFSSYFGVKGTRIKLENDRDNDVENWVKVSE